MLTVGRLVEILKHFPQDSIVIVKTFSGHVASPNIVGQEHYVQKELGWEKKFPAKEPLPVMICLD